ncbi:hypothetical protein [Bradyrhizobium sp. BR 10261]|uniref:hypothetical protein n=1 Tax=Bradyrhizobium sp. BR 10261 TaxID=2749992 RepID=UPI001C6457C2|nr:hypothetical protein [Bradyrhizobium sp. BR 10261]MBW7962519.1 hypothetical protein [Bradyrhizobium sp. BR 10261]
MGSASANPPSFSVEKQVMGVTIENEIGNFQVGALQAQYGNAVYTHLLIYTGLVAPVPFRIQSGCELGTVVGDSECDCRPQLVSAMKYIFERGNGLIVHTGQHDGRGRGLLSKLEVYRRRKETGETSAVACQRLGIELDHRDFRQFGEILKYLNIGQVVLLSTKREKIEALRDCGISIAATVDL